MATAGDLAWSSIFDRHDIRRLVSSQGYADVTANDLRAYREPRLLTKIDHRGNLPAVFKESGLSLLTLSIKNFRIGPFESFMDLPMWEPPGADVRYLQLPEHLETLDPSRITGEPAAINAAKASGMLDDFLGESTLLTVSGRMRTSAFDYSINKIPSGKSEVSVTGAQIEIDAAFEGASNLSIFEVKNHISPDFLVRQVYYPYRVWSLRVAKPIRNVFMTFANDVFDLDELLFEDPNDYSSAVISQHKRYMIDAERPSASEVLRRAQVAAVESTHQVRPEAPFPQADRFERVMDIVALLSEAGRTVDELALVYSFDPRQSDYYYNAAKFLGLAASTSDDSGQELRIATDLGASIVSMPYREKILKFAECILKIHVVAQTYLKWAELGIRHDILWVMERLSVSEHGSGLAESTLRRRSQTVLSWADWLREVAP